MTIPEKAVKWALDIAADNSHGYSQQNRWGPDYDCSSFVISAYEQAGVPVKEAGASYTGNMKNAFRSCGFQVLPAGSPLKVGDVLLNETYHTVMFIGNNQVVAARRNEDGFAGDGTGREITTQNYYYYPNGGWDCILRYAGSETVPDNTPESSTVGQQMANHIIANRKRPTIQFGDTGNDVMFAQAILVDLGYLNKGGKDYANVDGDFGLLTKSAVLGFQASTKGSADPLEIDGIIGKNTWAALIQAVKE